MDVHESTMDPLGTLTQKIKVAESFSRTELNTETLTYEPVEGQTQSVMDSAASCRISLETKPAAQVTPIRDEAKSHLNTETLTYEPVEEQTQSRIESSASSSFSLLDETATQLTTVVDSIQNEAKPELNPETLTDEPYVGEQTHSALDSVEAQAQTQTQQFEVEHPSQLGDTETQTLEKAGIACVEEATQTTSGVEPPTQSGDAEFQSNVDLQKHFSPLLQVVRELTGSSADSSLEVLAKTLQERWQQKETETNRLREELRQTAEQKTAAQAQVKTLIKAACSISEATEESSPEDAAEKLLEGRKALDDWRSEARASWRQRYTTMKSKMADQIKTLVDPIRLISGSKSKTPQVLAESLKLTWDQVQAQNDELDLELKKANDRVQQLEVDLQTQTQNIKCLADDVGLHFEPEIAHVDVVSGIRRSFNELQEELRDREQHRLAARDSITAKNKEIKDLKSQMESLMLSLEDLQLLASESKKKGKKLKEKLRPRWWRRTQEQQVSKANLAEIQSDLTKKSATISLLEAKLTMMADRVERLQESEKREKDRVERQKASRRELQNDIKLLKFDNTRKETLIQSLRDLVETLKNNCSRRKRGGFRYRVKNTVDHTTIASMPNIRCELLDVEDILPFPGYKLPGDLGNMRILGKGTYGMVYLGRYAEGGKNIAIKKPTLPASYCQELVKEEKLLMKGRAMKESMLQQLLSGSPYFPKILGMVTIDEDLCTVMDFIGDRATGKTYPLYQALTRFMPNPRLDMNNMFKVCEDIIKGIMELHEKGFLHNDLKSNNVLLEKRSQRWHAVIIDLGLVSTIAYANQKRFSEEKRAEYRAGKGCYFLAPEVVLYGERYSVASDIFSFGVLLKPIAKKIEVEEVQVLADSCSKQDPLERPQSMKEILHKMEAISASY